LSSEPRLEENPKWAALRDVLDEIDEENKRLATEDQPQQRVLVVAVDDRTCSQIKQVGHVLHLSRVRCEVFTEVVSEAAAVVAVV